MSVTGPAGFVAAGGGVGIKGSGTPDLAVVATEDGRPVAAAGVFTTSLAAAAPVQVSRAHLSASRGRASAVVLTSGNANAATGEPGRDAAEKLCGAVAREIGSAREEVLVCQTGLIGVPFPIDDVEPRVGPVVERRNRSRAAAAAAAEAIMTTDTVPKEVLVRSESGGGFTVGGMAKGAAMLAPNMATMLAVLTTDAQADPVSLQRVLAQGVASSFNTITVDGCASTNDTVLILASGRAGPVDLEELGRSVHEVCMSLATQMVADAEGATKMVTVRVVGAGSDAEAHRAARQVAESQLVKCSLNGEDPYWGRVVAELGVAGVGFDLDRVSVSYGGIRVCVAGVAASHDAAEVARHMAGRHIEMECDLGLGAGRGAVLTTDLGYGDIDENRTTS